MHPIIAKKLPKIAEICSRYWVRRLELFGSVARGVDFVPEHSDADFLVEFGPDNRDLSPLARFFGGAIAPATRRSDRT